MQEPRVLLLLLLGIAWACACATHAQALPINSGDPSYVVQIHAAREGFVAPDGAALRSQLMTTESGDQFECFLPLTRAQRDAEENAKDADDGGHGHDSEGPPPPRDHGLLAFGRAAVKKVRPKCMQYVDLTLNWVYEICPGVLIRRVRLELRIVENTIEEIQASALAYGRPMDTEAAAAVHAATAKQREEEEARNAKKYRVKELAAFSHDETSALEAYNNYVGPMEQTRIAGYPKPVYTQVFRPSAEAVAAAAAHDDDEEEDPLDADNGEIKLQFVCSAAARDNLVAGVLWRNWHAGQQIDEHSGIVARSPASFVILSRMFCDPRHAHVSSDPEDAFTVSSLLRPLVDMRTCIKRNEGWWTYEFCFGRGVRQYHRDSDGHITAEFSLGHYDEDANRALEASGAALVSDHVDVTHDVARPAFVEMYTEGTHCKEYDVATPRQAKVHYYCSQGGTSHHILTVKETQTCMYSIKVSSPVVCDHPHFITDEQRGNDKPEVVHCVPVQRDGDADSDRHEPEGAETMRPPIQEVVVSAT